MRLQLLSDVHTEFHADRGEGFVRSLDPRGVDVLVLAGDIAAGEGLPAALALFCDHYADAHVVFVHGNHEFYGSDREAVLALTHHAVAANPNLVWLDGDVREIAGHRVLGTPLWFRSYPLTERLRRAMCDFSMIRGYESWVYEENARAVEFLERELREGDIVVTHHLPSQRSVAARFSGHPLNPFFVCDVEDLIRERGPRLWLHGHTHNSVDVRLGGTTIRCNPFGYVGFDLNSEFSDALIVEV
jgi:Icc-related predicted phosphoesterase